jgi:hypothetical protein
VTLKMMRSDQGDGTAELVCNFDAPHPLAMWFIMFGCSTS